MWKSTPRLVKITVGACAVLLVLSGFVVAQRRLKAPPPTAAPPAPSPGEVFDKIAPKFRPVDLVLSQSSLNSENRRIEGVVTNTSNRPYTDIQISFYLLGRDLAAEDSTTITIRSLGPHGSAKFATDPVSHTVGQWAVKEIKGTPRPGS